MSTQHTPKSWTCVQSGRFMPMDGWSADHEDFAITAAAPIKAGGKVIAIVVDGRDYLDLELAEMKANARLIAAAPDMYEALKSIVEDHDFCGDDWGDRRDAWIETARTALAKAKGKSC